MCSSLGPSIYFFLFFFFSFDFTFDVLLFGNEQR